MAMAAVVAEVIAPDGVLPAETIGNDGRFSSTTARVSPREAESGFCDMLSCETAPCADIVKACRDTRVGRTRRPSAKGVTPILRKAA